jgi:hypothetical protein
MHKYSPIIKPGNPTDLLFILVKVPQNSIRNPIILKEQTDILPIDININEIGINFCFTQIQSTKIILLTPKLELNPPRISKAKTCKIGSRGNTKFEQVNYLL